MIALSWSGGKDSARALQQMRHDGYPPSLLLATVDETSGRTTHHGVRGDLLRAQARAAGMDLVEIPVPPAGSPATYSERMRDAFARPPLSEVSAVAFGDLFLDELRAFREERLAAAQRKALFPIWGRDTARLAGEIVTGGCRAVVVSIDSTALTRGWLGRPYDSAFLRDLPPKVDPCGENGEFHTFVTRCPAFSEAILVTLHEVIPDRRFPRQEIALT